MISRFGVACIPLTIWLFSGTKLLAKALYLALHNQFSPILAAQLFAAAWVISSIKFRLILKKSVMKQHELDAQLLIKEISPLMFVRRSLLSKRMFVILSMSIISSTMHRSTTIPLFSFLMCSSVSYALFKASLAHWKLLKELKAKYSIYYY
ncbi:hypothetical protein C6H88_01930 [Chlamydia muridarum str. Nigg]|jgi:hypothetical protein|uniref:Membrane protein n=1 Tax=Chlamydia muridarum TaxID=83560 RepID=A0A070A111_CHLMR|nr:hypothetical protein [Chlamydia muridarum]UFT40115.1 hypothetical protein FTN62_02015 [Chlamydia trachomatis]AHH22763.1 membrane protein [Chlamydia muridarum str. Nigg3 CMUT3-5]AHH23688.1 membrane protein [Chlamydia muridarum str. Nigg CM972]AID37902.1 membrane protein [Chlamydia muridarum str. Nigg 2 MCR]AIT90569.1 membrane protein [Chlamydia muridarum]